MRLWQAAEEEKRVKTMEDAYVLAGSLCSRALVKEQQKKAEAKRDQASQPSPHQNWRFVHESLSACGEVGSGQWRAWPNWWRFLGAAGWWTHRSFVSRLSSAPDTEDVSSTL